MDIRRKLFIQGKHIPDFAIVAELRQLMKEGLVTFEKSRWQSPDREKIISTVKNDYNKYSIHFPSLSDEARSLLALSSFLSPLKTNSIPSTPEEVKLSLGPWEKFRSLVNYYCDCIRNDGRAEAKAFFNESNNTFLFLPSSGKSLPRPGRPWHISIPIGEHLSRFIQRLTVQGDDSLLILAYPIQAIHICREGEPDVDILKPVFYVPVNYSLEKGALSVHIDSAVYQVDLDWLQHTFNTPEKKRSFFSACGFFLYETDDDLSLSSLTLPALEHLTATLSAFCAHRLIEPLRTENLPSQPLHTPLSTGIYNRPVLMVATRPQYTKNLLRELNRIRDAADVELDSTALRFLFRETDKTAESDVFSSNVHIADVITINNDQRFAAGSLLNEPLTVVTGPPGTGKSQVVSAVIANSHLYGRSVLFASRNHKSIDAVYERCHDIKNRPILTRCNSREDPSLKMTFSKAIKQLRDGSSDHEAAVEASLLFEELIPLLEDRDEKLRLAKQRLEWQERIGCLEQQLSQLELGLPPEVIKNLISNHQQFPTRHLKSVQKDLNRIRERFGTGSVKYSLYIRLTCLLSLSAWTNFQKDMSHFPGIKIPKGIFPTPSKFIALQENLTLLNDVSLFCELQKQILSLEPEIKKLPDYSILSTTIQNMHTRILDLSCRTLERQRASTGGLSIGEDRESLANLRTVLDDICTGMVHGELQVTAYKVLKEQLPRLFRHFPCWAVTSLSAGSHIPLLPAIFDLVIIDEASQSDIPSAIPLFFRARRAGVIGDPNQLTHITSLTRTKDVILRRRAGLDRLADQRFSYVDSSLYTLFADTTGVAPVLLATTYRSVAEIAEYSNELFYGGRLKVETDTARLPTVPGFKPGLHWLEVDGEVKSGGSSGAWCGAEITAVKKQIQDIIGNGFKGTLGVVTPFREQANRIRDAIHDGSISWESLRAVDLEVSTSHGFQGGERDVILFSLCARAEMPQGALNFLRETGNLFNVAVSRARAVLQVIGNRSWASHCGIRHIEKLARPALVVHETKPVAGGAWFPHESPWEQKLYQALIQRGLSPIPQHPVVNRRLDLALIRPGLHLDIEVDGASFHRNPDGSRKTEDIWRDIQLIGIGWKILRFWVYQLRGDMDGCANRILNEWSNSHE
jgi:very-short-patch-repair endonuclease